MSQTEPLKTACALRELIESEAESAEEKGTMTEPVIDALVDTGLFRLLVPKAFDGLEADPATIIDVCEELSFSDGSVGWAFAQNTTVGAYAAYLAPEFGEPLARARASAGMFAPLGVAYEEKGGYRVSGRYPFGSGSGHAEFMGGCALLMRDGQVAPIGKDGKLPVIAFILPADRVELKGNWDVMGLRGTGSFDFEVPEQYVDAGQTFSLFEDRAITGGSLYGLGPVPVGTISSAAWALGVARRALHEIAEIAKGGRTRLGSLPLREHTTFQRDFGLHGTAVDGARALAKQAYGSALDAVVAGAAPEVREDRVRATKAAATHVARVSQTAVTFAYGAAGSAGMRNPNKLQRCFRDIHVGVEHQVFDDRNYNELAKPALGLEPAPF